LEYLKKRFLRKALAKLRFIGYSPRYLEKQTEIKYDNIDVLAKSTIISKFYDID